MNDHDRDAPAPTLVGIVGDSGSGKTTVAHAVRQLLGPERVTELQLDDYHRYTREERQEKGITALHPDAHDFALMREHLQLLRQGRPVRVRGALAIHGVTTWFVLDLASQRVAVRDAHGGSWEGQLAAAPAALQELAARYV